MNCHHVPAGIYPCIHLECFMHGPKSSPKARFYVYVYILFWLFPWPVEVPMPGIKSEPQQWQYWILNLLGYYETPQLD